MRSRDWPFRWARLDGRAVDNRTSLFLNLACDVLDVGHFASQEDVLDSRVAAFQCCDLLQHVLRGIWWNNDDSVFVCDHDVTRAHDHAPTGNWHVDFAGG